MTESMAADQSDWFLEEILTNTTYEDFMVRDKFGVFLLLHFDIIKFAIENVY
jgi:hypothetical protein